MRRLHTADRRSRTATARLPAVLAPDLTSRQKPSPHVLLAAFETILRTTSGRGEHLDEGLKLCRHSRARSSRRGS